MKLFAKECLHLMRKVITGRFSDNKRENDRCLGCVNVGRVVSVYQMYCGRGRTRGRKLYKLLEECMSADKSLNKGNGKGKSEIFKE